MKTLLAGVLCLLLVGSCLGSDFADSVEGSWMLESASLDGEPIELRSTHPVTMVLDSGRVSGTAACNGYRGDYHIDGPSFEIVDGLAVSEMGCIPEGIMATERRYLDALLASDRISLDDGRLTLSGAGASLVFVAADQSEEEATAELFAPETQGSWQLVTGSADSQPIPLVDSHPVTLEVREGEVGGTSACNHYGLRFTADGAVQVEGTAMACEPEVMTSETAYVAAITRVTDATIEGERLVATGDDVELVFARLEPAPVAQLVGREWVLESLIEGDAVTSVTGERATLTLDETGSFEGSTGCRSIAGVFTVTGAEVVFTSWGADGECSADLADQDALVVTVLGDGFRAEVEGDTLTLWSRGDEGLIYRAGS